MSDTELILKQQEIIDRQADEIRCLLLLSEGMVLELAQYHSVENEEKRLEELKKNSMEEL